MIKPTDVAESRLTGDERRELLLDVAAELVGVEGVSGVTMGTVADRAEVTRALVYKHFDNREQLLLELFRREAARVDAQIVAAVQAAPAGFEPKLRAMVHATLASIESHGRFFHRLRMVSDDSGFRQEQRGWNRRTSRYFTHLAKKEYALSSRDATAAMAVLLGGIETLTALMRERGGEENRSYLVDLYVSMVLASLRGLVR